MVATANHPRSRRAASAAPSRPPAKQARRSSGRDGRPSLEVLAPPAPAPRVRRAVAVVAVLFGVALLFGVAASHVVLTQNQSKLDALDKRARAAQATYEKLRFQVAELESPERVVAEAQRRLGMVSPADVTYVNAPPAPTKADPAVAGDIARDAAQASAGDWRRVKAELAGR